MSRCGNENIEEESSDDIETRQWDALDDSLRDLLEKHHDWRKLGDESKYDGQGMESFHKAHLRYREELDSYIENKISNWLRDHPPRFGY